MLRVCYFKKGGVMKRGSRQGCQSLLLGEETTEGVEGGGLLFLDVASFIQKSVPGKRTRGEGRQERGKKGEGFACKEAGSRVCVKDFVRGRRDYDQEGCGSWSLL